MMQTHMEYKDRRGKSVSKREFQLEEEHEKMMKQLDIKNYSLSRIPRPSEEAPQDTINDKEYTKGAIKPRTWVEWWEGK